MNPPCVRRDTGRVIPGSDIAPVCFPLVPPQDNVGKVYESKQQDGNVWNYPEWDIAGSGPKAELILARHDYVISEEHLHLKKLEYAEERKLLDAQWNELAKKEDAMRKSFIMYHKFVRENREKKERATQRIQEEEKIHARRDEEIDSITQHITKLTEVKEKLLQSIEDIKIYEDFLANVVQDSVEFKSIVHILNRYDALIAAKADLLKRQMFGLDELEKKRKHMLLVVEQRMGFLMGQSNSVANLEEKLVNAHIATMYWEKIVYNAKSRTTFELVKVYQIRDSIWNLYTQMCTRKGEVPEFNKDNCLEILEHIKGTIVEYIRIHKIASKKIAKDQSILSEPLE